MGEPLKARISRNGIPRPRARCQWLEPREGKDIHSHTTQLRNEGDRTRNPSTFHLLSYLPRRPSWPTLPTPNLPSPYLLRWNRPRNGNRTWRLGDHLLPRPSSSVRSNGRSLSDAALNFLSRVHNCLRGTSVTDFVCMNWGTWSSAVALIVAENRGSSIAWKVSLITVWTSILLTFFALWRGVHLPGRVW